MTSLEIWLEKATRCLSAESAAMVRSEIQEHYESARDAALDRGVTLPEADQAALYSLGDPRTANRQYRRVLLTATEAQMLRNAQWEGRTVCASRVLLWLLRAIPVAVLCAAAITFVAGQSFMSRLFLLLAVGSVVFIAGPTLPIYTPSRARIFRWVKWTAIIVTTALAFGSNAADWFGAIAICASGVAWIEWTRHSIRRKLPVAKWPKELFL
jgi:hypothetical protein